MALTNVNRLSFSALVFGVLTLLIFALTPQIVNLIEPAPSLAEVVLETAEMLKNHDLEIQHESKREKWHTAITSISFVLLGITIILSVVDLSRSSKKIFGITGLSLCAISIGIYLTHLALGIIGLLIVVILAVVVMQS